jgi:hypothetical protein
MQASPDICALACRARLRREPSLQLRYSVSEHETAVELEIPAVGGHRHVFGACTRRGASIPRALRDLGF